MNSPSIQVLDSTWQQSLHQLSEHMQINHNAQAFVMRRQPDFFSLMQYQGRHGVVLGAVRGASLLGAMTVNFDRVFYDGTPRWCAYTADLRVSPAARGQGLGDRLMQAAIDLAFEKHPHCVILTSVTCDNAAGLRKNEKLFPRVHMQKMTQIQTLFYPCFKLPSALSMPVPETLKVHVTSQLSEPLQHEVNALWQRRSCRTQAGRIYENLFKARHAPPVQYHVYLRADHQLVGYLGLWDQSQHRQITLPNQPALLKNWLYGKQSRSLAMLCGTHLCVEPAFRRYLPLLVQASLTKGRHMGQRILGLALDTADPLHCFLPTWPHQQNKLWLLSSEATTHAYPFRPELALG